MGGESAMGKWKVPEEGAYHANIWCKASQEREKKTTHVKPEIGPGVVAHTCNTSTFGRLWQVNHLRSGVRYQPGQHGETSSLLKIQKISQAWWRVPVVPAIQEAEAGE